MVTRLIWADCETTGLRPDRGAEIWELALIVRDEHDLTDTHQVRKTADDEYVWHFRPRGPMDPMALRVGGYYERNAVIAAEAGPGTALVVAAPGLDPDKAPSAFWPGAAAVAREIAGLLDGAHLIATNPAFDAGHLDAFLEGHGECLTADYHYTDIGSLVRGWAYGGDVGPVPFPLKLAGAARMFGIETADYKLHTALGDARLARDIYDMVIGGVRL